MAQRFLIDVTFLPWPTIVAEAYFVLAHKLQELVEPVTDISEYISQELGENFDVGGRPPWEPLTESTLARKARGNWPEDILIREGNLRDEVTSPDRWEINRESHGATGVFVSGPFISEYGHFHITGFHDRGGGDVPARNFMDIPAEMEDEIEDKFTQWVNVQVNEF